MVSERAGGQIIAEAAARPKHRHLLALALHELDCLLHLDSVGRGKCVLKVMFCKLAKFPTVNKAASASAECPLAGDGSPRQSVVDWLRALSLNRKEIERVAQIDVSVPVKGP